jgi:hypothetical protein
MFIRLVHPIGAHTDFTAQASGAKFEVFVETVFDFLFVAGKGTQFFFGFLTKVFIF